MDDVLSFRFGEIMTDRSGIGLRRIRGSDEETEIRYRILFFEDDQHTRATRHEVRQVSKKGLLLVNGVKSFCLRF